MNSIGKLLIGAGFTCISFVSVGSASAATITALTSFSTLGSDMDGMEVTVNFQDGTSSTALWADLNATSGGAGVGGWSLTQSGNTASSNPSNNWVFQNNTSASISSLVINAILGKTVFDITPLNPSTPGSAGGRPFTFVSGVNPTTVLYDNIVNIDGQAAVGDLFGELTLSWANGFSSGNVLRYRADTDNATFVVSTDNPSKPVPVPGVVAGVALAAGFFGNKEINKRKAKQKVKA